MYAKGLLNKAMKDYNRAIELNPTSDAYNERGMVWRKLGNVDTAIENYNKSIELNASDKETYVWCTIAYEDKGNWARRKVTWTNGEIVEKSHQRLQHRY